MRLDRDDRRVPTSVLNSFRGPQHCDWKSVTFLSLRGKTFVGDPEHVLPQAPLATSYAAAATLPADAQDTGFHRDGTRLWAAANGSAICAARADGVQRWPWDRQPPGCA